MNLWYRANKDFPEYKLHLVPFEYNHEGILTEVSKLGEKFDFLIGVCDSKSWLSRCEFLPLGRYKKMLAVSREHPLATKSHVDISDLSVFNRCAETKNVLLTIECWSEVHPGLVTIPVDWDYSIAYGLLYSSNAPDDVLRFVKAVKDTISDF